MNAQRGRRIASSPSAPDSRTLERIARAGGRGNGARVSGISDREVHDLVARLGSARRGGLAAPGHDVAAVRVGGSWLALKVDPTIAGVHVEARLRDAGAIARKAMGRPASDLAAAGVAPRWALVSVGFPRDASRAFVESLVRALFREARGLGARLVGGHTGFRAPRLEVHVTLAGVSRERPRTRDGARAGDRLLATGAFGGSILGKHLRFRPRLREARLLARAVPIHAAIDVSDGLAIDAARLAQGASLALVLDAERIPVAPAARRLAKRSGRSPLSHALGDGEDYELLLAVPARQVERALSAARRARFPLVAIGTFRRGSGTFVEHRSGAIAPVAPSGFVARS